MVRSSCDCGAARILLVYQLVALFHNSAYSFSHVPRNPHFRNRYSRQLPAGSAAVATSTSALTRARFPYPTIRVVQSPCHIRQGQVKCHLGNDSIT